VVWQAGGGGGGGCHVANPSTTMVTLDGVVAELGTGLANELTTLGTADDGTQFVLDQFAIVRAHGNRLETRMETHGFGGVTAIESVLEILRRVEGAQAQNASDSSLPTPEADVLLIHHQGEHPQNHRFTPTPLVTFQPQSYRAKPAVTLRGWAAVTFGTRGQAETVRLLPADGGMTSPSLEAKVLRGVRGDFLDERRHTYIGYFAYQAEGGRVEMKGSPIVVLPMCCQADCPPAPGSCY